MAIVIKPDGKDEWCALSPVADFKQASADDLIEVIRQAGISGMGALPSLPPVNCKQVCHALKS
ncbi:electron transport complex protein RnfC [Vibrio astriarenae]|nr:electron transport complex protein RnfC [Vibrio sp. C7]